jgi:hypothetical protein
MQRKYSRLPCAFSYVLATLACVIDVLMNAGLTLLTVLINVLMNDGFQSSRALIDLSMQCRIKSLGLFKGTVSTLATHSELYQ